MLENKKNYIADYEDDDALTKFNRRLPSSTGDEEHEEKEKKRRKRKRRRKRNMKGENR